MSKIELITQPESCDDGEAQKSSLTKLQALVNKNPATKGEAPQTDEGESFQSQRKDLTLDSEKSRCDSTKNESVPEDESQTGAKQQEVDHDGFEIPQGKIPLDGHFTTSEIKQLVNLAREEGLISKGVELNMVSENHRIGDKVQIKDSAE